MRKSRNISKEKSMENNIKYSPEALNDLQEIWIYIYENLSNPIAAENTVNGITDSVDKLKQFPKAGSILEYPNGINIGYRFVQYKNYIVFYRISENDVVIDRIIYGKSDYMKILFEDKTE